MTIGEHHPYKLIGGRLHRLLYRNKWLPVKGKPLDWRYYDGQEKDENRYSAKVERYYKILIKDNTNGTAHKIQQNTPQAGR